MLTRLTLTALILIIPTISGCTADADTATPSVVVSESEGITHVRIASLTPADVPAWAVHEVFATAAPIELFHVTAARFLPDGTIALANAGTSEIFVLDDGGALQRTMGGKGEGPGEFSWISGLEVDSGGSVVAYDPRRGRLTRFAADGQVVATQTLAPPSRVVDLQPLTILGDGRLAAVHGEMRVFAAGGEKRDTTPLMLFDADGSRADTIGMWPATEWAFIAFEGGVSRTQPGFGRTVAWAGRDGRFAIGSNDSLDVSVFDREGSPTMRISGTRGGDVLPADVERWREDLIAARSQSPEAVRRALGSVPHRATYPAFEMLVVDDEGRVWIGSWVPPGAAERHWLIIGVDGRAHGRLALPAALRILDAAGDRIAVLGRDELDEEYVRVLRLATP